MTKTPISRKTLREQVAEILRKKILNGDIQSGERIVEADLARELQMSRGRFGRRYVKSRKRVWLSTSLTRAVSSRR